MEMSGIPSTLHTDAMPYQAVDVRLRFLQPDQPSKQHDILCTIVPLHTHRHSTVLCTAHALDHQKALYGITFVPLRMCCVEQLALPMCVHSRLGEGYIATTSVHTTINAMLQPLH